MRRELWETVVDLLDAVDSVRTVELGIYITSLTFDLPVEVMARKTEVGFKLLVDLPQSRWESGFRDHPGRLRIHLQEGLNEQL